MKKDKSIKIVITGAESTGKSTITNELATHFNAMAIPELARSYVEKLNRHYNYNDVVNIARMQIEIEENAKDEPFVFLDTWLIITKVWFDFVYGEHPGFLDEAIMNSTVDLFLVCDIDIPWIPDPVRENGGLNREKLHSIYIKELEKNNFNYKIVTGNGEKRILNGIRIVEDFLKSIE